MYHFPCNYEGTGKVIICMVQNYVSRNKQHFPSHAYSSLVAAYYAEFLLPVVLNYNIIMGKIYIFNIGFFYQEASHSPFHFSLSFTLCNKLLTTTTMGRRGCKRNLGRNGRSRGQHLRDSVHAGGNPSLTTPLPVQGIHIFFIFL